VLYGGEVGRGVVGAHPAFIIAEDHIHDPMQAIFDSPMISNDKAELRGQEQQRCDVEAGFLFRLSVNFSDALDDDDAVQPWPIVTFLEPCDIVDHGCCPGLDASMIAIDRLVATDGSILEAIGVIAHGGSSVRGGTIFAREFPWQKMPPSLLDV
jgi:hypothetical protein